MSIHKAKKFYQELTPQQKHFVDTKTINTTLSIKHWIAFLKKASDFDEYVETARKTLNLRLTLYIILLIVSIFLYFVFEVYYWLLPPVVISVLIFHTARTKSEFVKRDINNYLRLFFMPFLEAIHAKAGEEAKLSASLDFRDPFKAAPPAKSDYMRAGRKRNVSLYEHKVVIAGVTLADNSYLETALLDEIRTISYTNPRGKHKSKTKTMHRVFMRLSASKQVYTLNTPSSFPQHVEVSQDDNYHILKLKEKHKKEAYEILSPLTFFTSLGVLYTLLNPVVPLTGAAASVQAGQDALIKKLSESVVWNDQLFNQYDYDSIGRRGHSRLRDSTNDSQNVFDS